MMTLQFAIILSLLSPGQLTISQGKVPVKPNLLQRQEIQRQSVRYQSAVRHKNFDEAEMALVLLESLPPGKVRNRERAHLALWRSDFADAYSKLKLHFEGNGVNVQRQVQGAEDTRVWYWYLTAQRGNSAKANQILSDLIRPKRQIPGDPEFLNVAKVSNVKLAQVYVYMACYSAATTNYIRSQRYIELARKADPKAKISPKFDAYYKRYSPTTMEREEKRAVVPMFDHTAYLRILGKPVGGSSIK